MARPAYPPSPTSSNDSLSHDELTVHLIASGLIRLERQLATNPIVQAPYPASLQRGLDRLVADGMRRGFAPPGNLPELIRWCQQPLSAWPLSLADQELGTNSALLESGLITETCDAWACAASDVEAELTEQRLMQRVFDLCASAGGPDAYVAFRRLLISRPVLTAIEFQEYRNDPALEALAEPLEAAYLEAPAYAAVNGTYHCCPHCGNILLPDATRRLLCENARCRNAKKRGEGKTVPASDGVYWLKRGARRFIAAPGLVELDLATKLLALGLCVELWPEYDRYDLRVSFSDGEVWAIDVKDWAEPHLLAKRIKPIPAFPTWSRAVYVFPDERRRERRDYRRAFLRSCYIPQVEACFVTELLQQARTKLEKV